jgi:hypothetical protein
MPSAAFICRLVYIGVLYRLGENLAIANTLRSTFVTSQQAILIIDRYLQAKCILITVDAIGGRVAVLKSRLSTLRETYAKQHS